MNFLAHLWLAGPDEGLRLGAVAGDFIKGPLPGTVPADMLAGVALHRAIDSFSDAHPAFQRARARVPAPHRRFAGVMVDMFFDHFLAADWDAHHPAASLAGFAAAQYALLGAHAHRFPERAQRMIARMREGDWLSSYAEVATIEYALDRIATRLSRPERFLGCGQALRADYDGFGEDAAEFLTEVRAFAEAERARLARRSGSGG
ncbi:MAG: DUF479 domain-containing protein [Proteobacteria bacterium]|nr:MAG: DUF479 domain-containing protein [Pseudomonadota bacterium]